MAGVGSPPALGHRAWAVDSQGKGGKVTSKVPRRIWEAAPTLSPQLVHLMMSVQHLGGWGHSNGSQVLIDPGSNQSCFSCTHLRDSLSSICEVGIRRGLWEDYERQMPALQLVCSLNASFLSPPYSPQQPQASYFSVFQPL